MRNAVGLYVLQFGSYLLPIVTIMFLARLLGPDNWGGLAFMQAFASYGMMAVSYGFNYSATREAARHRHDPDRLADLLAGVLGAKLFLAALSIAVMVPLSLVVPQVHRSESLLAPAILWAFSFAFSLAWYYQGLERMAFVARWETLARLLSLAGLVAFVRVPGDAWKVLAIQGALQWAAIGVEMGVTYRHVPFRRPAPAQAWRLLRIGWSMFLFQGALSFYTVGNAFILGLFASPASVGYYVGAEKISRAFASLLFPVTQAIFPRISHLAATARDEAAHLVRTSFFLIGGMACAMSIFILIAAPVLVRVILGPGFDSAVIVLRILALLPPLVALGNVFGIQWSLALDLDRMVTGVMFVAAALNVTLAVILAPRYLHVGMAEAVIASEAVVGFGLYAALKLRRLDPLTVRRAPQPEASPVVQA